MSDARIHASAVKAVTACTKCEKMARTRTTAIKHKDNTETTKLARATASTGVNKNPKTVVMHTNIK